MITLQYLDAGVAWLPLPDDPSCGPEVILSCYDGTIIVPAAVLAALSPLFQSILRGSFCGCNEPYSLIFSEVSSKVVYALFQLLATGSTDMCTSYYKDVLTLAASFSIKLNSSPVPDSLPSAGASHVPVEPEFPLPTAPVCPDVPLPGVPTYPICPTNFSSVEVFLGFDENLNVSPDAIRFPCAEPSTFSKFPPAPSYPLEASFPLPLPSPLPPPVASTPALRQVTSTPKSKKRVQCAICLKMYAGIYKLRRHEAAVHDGFGESHQCDVCGFHVAGDRSHLSQHKARHAKLKLFHCKKCSFKAAQAGNLKLHYRSVHEGRRPYQCPSCNYSGKLRQHLVRHIRVKHREV